MILLYDASYITSPLQYVRFLFVQIVVGVVKLFLKTVENALVKDVYELRKISKSKFLLGLVQAVSSELQVRVMLDQKGK